MSIWERYSEEQRNEYIQFLQVYGALTNLFRQKQGSLIPYLDSKFQETVFAKIFKSENVDFANTPHDVISIFGSDRIGIGIKTFTKSSPSFQKVMQIKSYQEEISNYRTKGSESLARRISEIRNESLTGDHSRLGLSPDKNIYHYVTRDNDRFTIFECPFSLINLDNLQKFRLSNSSLYWSDGFNDYKYTYADSQLWLKFNPNKEGTTLVSKFDVKVIEDPFSLLLNLYGGLLDSTQRNVTDTVEVYLPLYSFRKKEVQKSSGLNAWNGPPKNPSKPKPRPLNEVYIPIPKDFHKKCPDFFTTDIFEFEELRKKIEIKKDKPKLRFHLALPNGKKIPSLLTQSNMKGLQSGSITEKDENGKKYGQALLGQWLLIDVLGLKKREIVTRKWLQMKNVDSVRLWRKKDDYSVINIDLAPFGAFETFMKDEPITIGED